MKLEGVGVGGEKGAFVLKCSTCDTNFSTIKVHFPKAHYGFTPGIVPCHDDLKVEAVGESPFERVTRMLSDGSQSKSEFRYAIEMSGNRVTGFSVERI